MAVDVSALERKLHQAAAATMAAVGPEVRDAIRSDGRTPYRDGELVRSVTVLGTFTGSGTSYGTRVAVPVIQAATTDGGARPHPIRPKRKRVLRFVASDGRVVFAREVDHPGNPPAPWFEDVVRDAFRRSLPAAARSAF